jgi:transcriptional regulator with XRE-family HTH domain
MSLRVMSEALARRGFKMSHSAIGEVERGVRRINIDELTAIAAVFGVSPASLLLPRNMSPEDRVQLSGTPETTAKDMVDWVRGDEPLEPEVRADSFLAEGFRRGSLPKWLWKPWSPPTNGNALRVAR